MILGIDLGQKTTGLALSEGMLTTPYKTVRHKTQEEALKKIIKIIDEQNINKVIIGFVEGKIKNLFQKFVSGLKKEKPTLEVIMFDETFTSRQARQTMVKLGIARRRRLQKEHKVAAALILQNYLDSDD